MARIRSVKPEFWADERLARDLTRDQRLFYVGLWNEADDEGRLRGNPRKLLGAIFPYDEDLDERFVDDLLVRLADTDRAVLYVVGGEKIVQLTKFSAHQSVNHPKPSKLPPPPKKPASALGWLSRNGTGSVQDTVPESSGPEVEVEVEVEQGTGNRENSLDSNAREATAGSDLGDGRPDEGPVHLSVPGGPELAAWIGSGGPVDRFVAAHPENARAVDSIRATYAQESLQGRAIWRGIPTGEQKAILADALETYGAEGLKYRGDLFRRFVETRARRPDAATRSHGGSPAGPPRPNQSRPALASGQGVHVVE